MPATPRTLSHVVYFVPDIAGGGSVLRRAARLQGAPTGSVDAGPFLRPAGTLDHHTLFFIQTPVYMKGCEHFAFHMGGPTELLLAGSRFVKAGYQSFWGPGRHQFGSNWFWYFNSPLGCHVEYDADMDTARRRMGAARDADERRKRRRRSCSSIARNGRRAGRRPAPLTWRIELRALCRLPTIAEGEARGFDPSQGGPPVFVVRRAGALLAYWDACPHYGDTPMAWRTDAYLNAAARPHRLRLARRGVRDRNRRVRARARRSGNRLQPAPVQTTIAATSCSIADNKQEEAP